MTVRLLPVLAALGFAGCANTIRIDEVAGKTIIPHGRIAVLGNDRPGAVSVGVSAGLRKPATLEWKDDEGDSLVRGHHRWDLPRWNLQTHAVWTPWEGVTFGPTFVAGLEDDTWVGATTLGLGLHAHLDRFAWQLEGRAGASWFRSTTRRRTSITDVASDRGTYLDSAVVDPLSGISLTGQIGVQFETAFPRQPFQLWSSVRWGVWNSTILADQRNDAVALSMLQEWSGGLGIHRRVARSGTISAGVVASRAGAADPTRGGDMATTMILQWESTFGASRKGSTSS